MHLRVRSLSSGGGAASILHDVPSSDAITELALVVTTQRNGLHSTLATTEVHTHKRHRRCRRAGVRDPAIAVTVLAVIDVAHVVDVRGVAAGSKGLRSRLATQILGRNHAASNAIDQGHADLTLAIHLELVNGTLTLAHHAHSGGVYGHGQVVHVTTSGFTQGVRVDATDGDPG